MSLPRIVTLDDRGAPALTPAPEVAALRRDHLVVVERGAPVVLGEDVRVEGPPGDQLDVELDLRLPPGRVAHLAVRADAEGGERTVIEVGRARGQAEGWLRLDRSRSSTDPRVSAVERGGPIPVDEDGRVRLRVLVDRSVLEVFANGRALTARVYPLGAAATRTEVTVPAPADGAGDGHPVILERLEGWQMSDIWSRPRRLWP
jgi:beta-fructofuranosidase